MNSKIQTPLFILILMLLVSACTPANEPIQEAVMPDLPDLGPAPEITNEVWINSDEPLTLASQRGKVVLVEFWTFG